MPALNFGARGAVGAPLVRCLVAQGQEDHAEFFVDTGQRPHVRRVAAVGFARCQWCGVVRVVAVPVPHQTAIVNVVGANHPGRLVGRLVVGHMAADDHQFTGDRRRRSGVVAASRERADAGGQVDYTLVTETFADFTGVGVQGDQAGVGGGQVEATRAGAGHHLTCVGDLRRRAAVNTEVAVFVVIRNTAAGHVGEALEAYRTLICGSKRQISAPVSGSGPAPCCGRCRHRACR